MGQHWPQGRGHRLAEVTVLQFCELSYVRLASDAITVTIHVSAIAGRTTAQRGSTRASSFRAVTETLARGRGLRS